jgi:hypothetical protein
VVVSDKTLKSEICRIVEEEEQTNYARRMGEKWLKDITVLRTTWSKPYIRSAPYIILIFKQVYGLKDDGEKKVHYYNEMSVCISCGLLLAAIQVICSLATNICIFQWQFYGKDLGCPFPIFKLKMPFQRPICQCLPTLNPTKTFC